MARIEKPLRITQIVYLAIAMALVLTPFISIAFAAATDAPFGPYADKVLIFKMNDQDKAVSMIESGDMHAWDYWFTKDEALAAARASAKVSLLEVSSSYDDILLNPVPTRVGFNPFSIQKIREALNWIIDRDYIVNEILNGRGVPRWTVFRAVAPDYVRNIAFMKDLEARYAYDFEKGKQAITEAMLAAGAQFTAGKWYYNNSLVVLKFLIRVGDERTPLGNYIAAQLEKLGFTVERRYGTSGDASILVWQADPREGTFHLYTGGWIATAVTAYDDGDPEFFFNNQYSTGRILSYYTPPATFANLLRKLAVGNYTTSAERNALIQSTAEESLKNSLRLFVFDLACAWPMTANVESAPYDLYGALLWRGTLAGMKLKGQTGGTLKIGNRYVLEGDAFNPIAGTNWMYDRIALDPVYDVAVWPHPHTGTYIPIMTDFKVQTAGPTGKLDVPVDAIKFDVPTDNWKAVGSGTRATSKTTLNFKLGKWHDGSPITMADVLSTIAVVYETCDENSPLFDPDAATSSALINFIQQVRGIKIVNSTAIDVYMDYWHVDQSYIAAAAAINGGIFPFAPWQLNEIMKAAVAAKQVAFGLTLANEWGVDWLDLARGPSLAILKTHFDTLKAQNFIPGFLTGYTTAAEATTGYNAIGTWYNTYGQFHIASGPFMLTKIDPTAQQIELTANRDHPLRASFWAQFSSPTVPDIRVSGPTEIERRNVAAFTVTSTYGGLAYGKVDVSAMLLSAAGKPISFPTATASGAGRFTISFTGNQTASLAPGAYTLRVIAVGQEAAIPVVKDAPFAVIAELSYFDREIKRIDADLNSKYTTQTGQIQQINTKLDEISSALGNINVALALGGVGVLLGLAALYLSLRKK